MRLKTAHDPQRAAEAAAAEIARTCADAVARRGTAVIAVSGGETPWLMLREFCHFDLPWTHIHVAQVDERIAPPGDPRRNLTRLEQILVTGGPLPTANLHAMPVNHSDVEQAALDYQRQLEELAGRPVVLDLVQLGLGTDGHTASLVPGDPVLAVTGRDVAVSGEYQGLRRMTLTFPAIDRARQRLWLVTGGTKAAQLRQLLAAEPATDVPATQVNRSQSVVIADEAAVAAARPD